MTGGLGESRGVDRRDGRRHGPVDASRSRCPLVACADRRVRCCSGRCARPARVRSSVGARGRGRRGATGAVERASMCLLVARLEVAPALPADRGRESRRVPRRARRLPLGWWQDDPRILAGRDLRGFGHLDGRGALRPLRRRHQLPRARATRRPTRRRAATLVTRFLSGRHSPQEYLDDLRGVAPRYAGFNLLLGGPRTLYYFSNRDGAEARPLGAGPVRPQQLTGSTRRGPSCCAPAPGSRNCVADPRSPNRSAVRDCSRIARRPTRRDRRTPACRRNGSGPCRRRSSCTSATARAARRCCSSSTAAARRCTSAGSTHAGQQTGTSRIEFASADAPERWFEAKIRPTPCLPTRRSTLRPNEPFAPTSLATARATPC